MVVDVTRRRRSVLAAGLTAIVGLTASATGCSQKLSRRSAEPMATETSTNVTGVPALSQRAADEEVIDLSVDGRAIVGSELAAPENSDADRTLSVRVLSENSRQSPESLGDVLDARFVRETAAVLVITREHWLERRERDTRTALDERVYGPLSLDAIGRWAVYTRGEIPELGVVRINLATGEKENIAPGLVPAWSPVISPDGTEVLVVASPDGTPGLYRVRVGQAPVLCSLPVDSVLPGGGPTAPVVLGDTLVYEDSAGLRTLVIDGPQTGLSRSVNGLFRPVSRPGHSGLFAQRRHTESAVTSDRSAVGMTGTGGRVEIVTVASLTNTGASR